MSYLEIPSGKVGDSSLGGIFVHAIAGEVNAIEICMTGFGLPAPDDWVRMYEEDMAKGLIPS